MPWGLPWWAWFLICCGICGLCALCLGPLGILPGMGGKKKSKAPVESVTTYEVVDVPDDTATAGYATGATAYTTTPAYTTGYTTTPGYY
eukprot:4493714-Amphidinium_carterae.1